MDENEMICDYGDPEMSGTNDTPLKTKRISDKKFSMQNKTNNKSRDGISSEEDKLAMMN